MKIEYVKKCFTCEFGFDNDEYHEQYNPVHPDVLEITCNGSEEHWGKKVNHDFNCNCWGPSFKEFSRCSKGLEYNEFYKDRIKLLPK